MKEQKRIQILSIFLLLSGFFVGSVIPKLFQMNSGSYAGFFSLYSFQKYKQTEVKAWNIFPYVLKSRIGPLIFLWMSGFTAAGLLFHAIYFWWIAAAAGMLLALFVLREGYHGVWLFFCALFPQWILYTAMWKREVYCTFMRSRREKVAFAVESEENEFLIKEIRKRPLYSGYGKELRNLGHICALCAAGSAAEAFLGTWMLKIFLQIL